MGAERSRTLNRLARPVDEYPADGFMRSWLETALAAASWAVQEVGRRSVIMRMSSRVLFHVTEPDPAARSVGLPRQPRSSV